MDGHNLGEFMVIRIYALLRDYLLPPASFANLRCAHVDLLNLFTLIVKHIYTLHLMQLISAFISATYVYGIKLVVIGITYRLIL
jgi:hypothetical protein